MALIRCKHCGGKVSTKAKACPHCGAPVTAAESETLSEYQSEPQSEQIPTPFTSTIETEPSQETNEAVEEYDTSSTGNKTSTIVIVVAILVVIAAAIYFGSQYLMNSDSGQYSGTVMSDTCMVDTVGMAPVLPYEDTVAEDTVVVDTIPYNANNGYGQQEEEGGFKTSDDVFDYLERVIFTNNDTHVRVDRSGIYVDGENLGPSPRIKNIGHHTALITSSQAKLRLDANAETLTDYYSGTVYRINY